MKRIKLLSAIFFIILGAGTVASAQADRPYRMAEDELKSLLERIEQSADRFRGSLDSALDRSRADGTRSEDNINDYIKEFERATDHLKSRFSENRSAASDVEEVLNRAVFIDRFMITHRLSSRAQEDWASLRNLLDRLAAGYGVTWSWAGVSDTPSRANDDAVKALLARIETNADRFRASLDAGLDRSSLDGSKTEDDINKFMKEFEQATDRLKDRYGDKQAATGIVDEVLSRGALINSFVYRRVTNARAREDWLALRNNLDELARIYNVSWQWEVLTS
jgi:hypothetical protein